MLKSVDEVIDELGGPTAMAELTGVGPSAVVNWRSRGIAPDKFLLVQKALKSRGVEVSPSVFAFKTKSERA